MINNKSILGLIPARGGSKRLPGKNILNLAGKPLISWTIEAALGSKFIDEVVVSTDDHDIKEISKKYGATVPFLRPDHLATDEATSVDTALHLLNTLDKNSDKYDYIILLQPTSPLRTLKDIDNSIELLDTNNCDAVIGVCEVEHSPLWCNKIPEDGDISNFIDQSIVNIKSQDFEQYYRINGAIYLCDINRLKKEMTFFLSSGCTAYKMDLKHSVDIDNKFDFNLASFMLDERNK